MNFRSDNATGAAPEVMQALVDANHSASQGYGGDEYCQRAEQMIKEAFEAPEAKVYFVSTGTAANALALATIVKPWEVIYCHKAAHIEEDEAGAPEFYTGGAKLAHIAAKEGCLDPVALREAIEKTGQIGVHNWQRGALSLTNITELGGLYQAGQLGALCEIAHEYDLPVHLDGARFANALIAAGKSAAEMSHRAGVDILVFGGTKNGLFAGEAVVIFDPERAWEFEMRRKRGGHLLSKGHLIGAQFVGFMKDENWLRYAQLANEKMRALYEEIGDLDYVNFEIDPRGNLAFVHLPRALHQKLLQSGAKYYLFPANVSLEGDGEEYLRARLVTSWTTSDEEITNFVKLVQAGY